MVRLHLLFQIWWNFYAFFCPVFKCPKIDQDKNFVEFWQFSVLKQYKLEKWTIVSKNLKESGLCRVIRTGYWPIRWQESRSVSVAINNILLLTEWEVSAGIYCPQPFPYLTDRREVNAEKAKGNIFLHWLTNSVNKIFIALRIPTISLKNNPCTTTLTSSIFMWTHFHFAAWSMEI